MQSDDEGAVCAACGVFDFLPFKCSRCHGKFCSEHIQKHFILSTQEECLDTNVKNIILDNSNNIIDIPKHQCVVCGSIWCVLTPCLICQEDFCATHRFHTHENEEKNSRRKVSKYHFKESKEELTNDFKLICSHYSSKNLLRLAPSSYKGSFVNINLLLCKEELLSIDNENDNNYSLGVISLEVAIDISIGQLLERLKETNSQLFSTSLNQPLYQIKGEKNISLNSIPLSKTVKESLLVNRIVVFIITQSLTIEEALKSNEKEIVKKYNNCSNSLFSINNLEKFLSNYLLSVNRDKIKDTRLHNIAVRVQMQLKQKENKVKKENNITDLSSISLPERLFSSEFVEPKITSSSSTLFPLSTKEDKQNLNNAPWPFRRPPPIDNFIFSYTKLKPRGVDIKSNSSDISSFIVVAVFIADYLLSSIVPPFCIVLAKDWSLGRVLDRILQFVEETVFIPKGIKWKIFDMKKQENLTLIDGNLSQKHNLKDNDILFLGEEFPEVLRLELLRLQELQGKEAATLRMKMMKNCVLM